MSIVRREPGSIGSMLNLASKIRVSLVTVELMANGLRSRDGIDLETINAMLTHIDVAAEAVAHLRIKLEEQLRKKPNIVTPEEP